MLAVFLLCAAFALSAAAEPQVQSIAQQRPPVDEVVPVALDQTDEMVARDQSNSIDERPEVPVAEMTQRLDEGEAPSQEDSRSYCPSGWSRFGYRCFNFLGSPKSWADAELHCLRLEGNLASIHTAQEYRFIQDIVREEAAEDAQAWIGGTDAVKNRQWFWSDGSKFDFHAWGTSQPNNSGGRQPCIEINEGSEKRWNDWRCDDQRPFVCARKLLMC